jgi:hypothetical protein
MRMSCRDRGANAKAGAMLIVGALVGAVVVTIAPAGRASACSCATATLEGELADAAAAFVGVARGQDGDEPRSWTFEVVEVIAGDLGEHVEVWQAMQGECGPNFELGELIGVVIRRDGNRFVTDDCGGVWLPEELLAPGTLSAPTGTGPPVLVATGRTDAAMLAAYDAEGDLLGWASATRGKGCSAPGSARDRRCSSDSPFPAQSSAGTSLRCAGPRQCRCRRSLAADRSGPTASGSAARHPTVTSHCCSRRPRTGLWAVTALCG